jgi:hypothetical protein
MRPLLIVLIAVLVIAIFGHIIGAVICLAGWIYGVLLSFQANLWLGLASFFFPPIGVVIGVGSFVTGRNIARMTL